VDRSLATGGGFDCCWDKSFTTCVASATEDDDDDDDDDDGGGTADDDDDGGGTDDDDGGGTAADFENENEKSLLNFSDFLDLHGGDGGATKLITGPISPNNLP
jgi:hypothetical protein